MRWRHGAALVAGSGAIWALMIALRRAVPTPFPLDLFLAVAAVGLPAFFAAALAYRWRLPAPLLWTAVGYSLGSALVTGLAAAAPASAGASPLLRGMRDAGVHFLSGTLLVPTGGDGYAPFWANLLWLAAVLALGNYGIETYRSGRRAV